MKAVCITPDGHARCVPDSATILRRNPWFVPADGTPGQWRATLYAGAVIDRLGMCIRAKFAGRYYSRRSGTRFFDFGSRSEAGRSRSRCRSRPCRQT